MEIPGVKTSTKTGTSDRGGNAKDIWMVSYSPALTMAVWLGNSDATILKSGTSSTPGAIIAKVMEYAHKEVYAPKALWTSGDWYTQPSGIQKINNELYPSWWNKTQGQTTTKLMFDKVSKKKATDLTPDGAKIELDVIKVVDPMTKKDVITAPDGYDANSDDDAHKATDTSPTVTISADAKTPKSNKYTITVTAIPGNAFAITDVKIKVGDAVITTLTGSGTYDYEIAKGATAMTLSATVTDAGYYTGTGTGIQLPAYNEAP